MSKDASRYAGLHAEIRPGIPGGAERVDGGAGAYPVITADVIKLLGTWGVTAEYVEPAESRVDLSLNAADQWLPILFFVGGVPVGVLGSLIADLISDRVNDDVWDRGDTLHVKFGWKTKDGEAWFDADGSVTDVLAALDEMRQDPSDDEGI